MENNKKNIYITDYIKLFFGRKLLFSLITIITTIVLVLVLYFGVSKPNKVYTATFSYSNSNLNTSVDYKNLISSTNLNLAKDKSEDFKNIDLTKLREKNKISISKNTNEDDTTYTLSISKKYIGSKEVAIKYINELLGLPIERLIDESVHNYDYNLILISEANTYEKKLDYIERQYEILKNAYTKVIENSSTLSITDYDNLVNTYNNYAKAFVNVNFSSLKTKAINNGYIDDFDNIKDNLKQELVSEIDTYIDTNEKIKLINSGSILDSNYYELVDSLYETKSLIKSLALKFLASNVSVDTLTSTTKISSVYTSEELTTMKDNIDSSSFDSYKESINNLINILKSNTTDVNLFETKLYSNITVQYENTNMVDVTGGISSILIVLISLVCGVALASITVIVLDKKKLYESLD